IFGIAARPVPADQARYFQAHLRVARAAGIAMAAMHRDVDRAALSVARMARLLDDTENLVAGSELRPLVPELEVRAAERGAQHLDQHLALPDGRQVPGFDGDPAVAVED